MSRLVFPKIPDNQRFLAVSETIANLDLAVSEGRLRIETNSPVDAYFTA